MYRDKVTFKDRQLVNDLAALRTCLHYLLTYDCVTFYRYMVVVKNEAKKAGVLELYLARF